jgi:trans-aconitate methyltransferase
MDLKEEDILKDNIYFHWYYVAKGLALLDFIKNIKVDSILDIGAGSGIFSKKLLQYTEAKDATCLDSGYVSEKEEVFLNKKINYIKSISHSNADLVLLMDVLEHVEDDALFVRKHLNNVKQGAYVVITVPAFQFLFSEHDIFLNHYRRYTISSLESCLTSSGLTVLKSRYYFFLLFPLMTMVRIFTKIKTRYFLRDITPKSDLKLYGNLVNKLLILINKAELLFFPFNKVAGLTVFCLAVKK